jgi:hypothetical protein
MITPFTCRSDSAAACPGCHAGRCPRATDDARRPSGSEGIDPLGAAVGDVLGPPLAVPVAKLVLPGSANHPAGAAPCPRVVTGRAAGAGSSRRARLRRTATTTARTTPASSKMDVPAIVRTTVRKMAGPTLGPTATFASTPRGSPSVWSRNLPGSSRRNTTTPAPPTSKLTGEVAQLPGPHHQAAQC